MFRACALLRTTVGSQAGSHHLDLRSRSARWTGDRLIELQDDLVRRGEHLGNIGVKRDGVRRLLKDTVDLLSSRRLRLRDHEGPPWAMGLSEQVIGPGE